MIDHPGSEKHDDHERVEAPCWASCLRYLPSGIDRSGGTQANGGAIVDRRCLFCRVTFVSGPPDSTSLAEKLTSAKKVSEWGTQAALPLCVRPAGLTEQKEQNGRWRNAQGESLPLRSRYG